MPSSGAKRVAGVDFKSLEEEEIAQLDFMARRLGFDRYIFCGYSKEELHRYALSHGDAGDGYLRVGVTMKGLLAARAIAHILLDFPFSYDLRREVHKILNDELTSREIQRNINGRKCPKDDQ